MLSNKEIEARPGLFSRFYAPWKISLRLGLGAVLAFRVAAEALAMLGLYGSNALSTALKNPTTLASFWQKWDAEWQIAIARDGFTHWAQIITPAHIFSSAAFQPFFPALLRLGAEPTGGSYLFAGLIIVTLFLGAAATGLHRLVLLDFGSRAATLSVFFLLIFPTAVFLGAPYPEPLVLAEVVWAFLAVRSKRYLLAGLLVGVATITKMYAVVFVVPLLVEALLLTTLTQKQRILCAVKICLGPCLGAAALAVFYWKTFGSPFRFLQSQQDWTGRHFAPPWTGIINGVYAVPTFSLNNLPAMLDLACVFFLVLALVYAWRHLRKSYAALIAMQLLVFTCTTAIVSTSRWTLDAFPLFITAGVWASHSRLRVLIISLVSAPLAIFILWAYSHGGFVG